MSGTSIREPWICVVLPEAVALDEMVDGRGGLRPHWRQLLGSFAGIGTGGLAEHASRLDRAFEDEGVTSILPGAGPRAWRCDPLPLPLLASEFATLTAGLAQRAELLEAVLQDLYGRQELLASGCLPPAAIFANDAFLRPACIPPRHPHARRFLDFYGADLVRGPDGAWRVIADRTAGAAGIAYARENRRMLARVLPEAFRGVQVRPLRPFFDIWQSALQFLGRGVNAGAAESASPGRPPQGLGIALLTPGTGSQHWYEHMMLARELSCALVEGSDLTVRGGAVFLKTLRGLQPVDVLLNRLIGRMIDPLELDGSSLIGVPGLLDAARGGGVRISNDPGTAVVEAPVLAAWLPALSQRLLGETLKLASVPTMWLGEAGCLEQMQASPESWLIRAATDGRAPSFVPGRLTPAALAALMAEIAASPWDFAATRALPPSVAPCAGPDGMTPRPVVLRMYLVFDGRNWQAMDGGLARVLENDEPFSAALPGEGLSKDVWVLQDEWSARAGPPVLPLPPLAIRRSSGDLPSRVADDLFWLGRYVERLEGSARLIRATLTRVSRGVQLPHERVELDALIRSLSEVGVVRAETLSAGVSGAMPEAMLVNAMLDSLLAGGAVLKRIASVAALTDKVRDRLTADMYGAVTASLRQIRNDCQRIGRSQDAASHIMVGILRLSASVAGFAAENMVRGGGWLFLELGRRIERAQAVALQVSFAIEQPPARVEAGLRLVLELCDSLITYRTRYLTVLQPGPVLDLVLADEGNPRGLAFQLAAIVRLLNDIDGRDDGLLSAAASDLLSQTLAAVGRIVQARDPATAASELPPALRQLGYAVSALSDRVTRHYFALLPVAQTVGLDEADLRGAA